MAWLGIHPLGGSAHGLVGTFAGATETRQAMRCGGKSSFGMVAWHSWQIKHDKAWKFT